jgi:hypothetical protein
MRRTAVLLAALLALAIVLPAGAQTDKAPAKPAAQEPAKPEAAKPESKPESKPVARKHNPRRSEDARHCLDKGTNTEIIKCAEAYL